MDSGQILGQVLRDLRRQRGRTQGSVARDCGYASQSPLSKIENGQKRAAFLEVWAICRSLGYSLSEVERGLWAWDHGASEGWRRRLSELGDEPSSWRANAENAENSENAAGGEQAQTYALPLGAEDARLLSEAIQGLTAFARLLSAMARRS